MADGAETTAVMLPFTRSLKLVLHPVHQCQGLGKEKHKNQQRVGQIATIHCSGKDTEGR